MDGAVEVVEGNDEAAHPVVGGREELELTVAGVVAQADVGAEALVDAEPLMRVGGGRAAPVGVVGRRAVGVDGFEVVGARCGLGTGGSCHGVLAGLHVE